MVNNVNTVGRVKLFSSKKSFFLVHIHKFTNVEIITLAQKLTEMYFVIHIKSLLHVCR